MAKEKVPNRFVKILTEGNGFSSSQRELWVDSKTGVTYAFFQSGYAGGLTPLLDAMGNPVISPVPRED